MVDMRPLLEDEINAAWHEVKKARAERDRYKAALERIVRPYRPMRERSRPAGVTEAIALLDATNQEQKLET